MSRSVVLVATTKPVMAYVLGLRLQSCCHDLGLRLEVCPGGAEAPVAGTLGAPIARVYGSAEALFDELESRQPTQLADTLVVLDVGADLEDSFASATSSATDWHVTQIRRIGVAAELFLRFPQVFPVIVSLAVPASTERVETQEPSNPVSEYLPKDWDVAPRDWKQFLGLCRDLCTLHIDGKPDLSRKMIGTADVPLGLYTPLHFVSSFDAIGLMSVLRRFARGMRCWFDPSGLRTLVRNRYLGTVFGSESDWTSTVRQRCVLLKRLQNAVVAVDEERAFVAFNAYAGYKLGCRAWMVTTYDQSHEHPLWNMSKRVTPGETLIIRDLDLRFPDIPNDKVAIREALRHADRDPWKRVLNDGEDQTPEREKRERWRMRVVSGDKRVDESDADRATASDEYDCERDGTKTRCYRGLRKPIGTLYRIRNLFARSPTSVASNLPPVSESAAGGHGAPYSNLPMAESLLSASRRCQGGPVENLLGAFLASEAYELLLGMSRTTALAALTEQHKHEVAAEVEFQGVAHAITTNERRDDVLATIKTLLGSTGDETSRERHLFLSQFWDELRVVYRQGEEFRAAEEANVESLVYGPWWQRSSREYPYRSSLNPTVALGVKRLVVWIATSLGGLALAHFVWIIVMSGVYATLGSYVVSWTLAGVRDTSVLVLSVAISSVSMQADGAVASLVAEAPFWGGAVAFVHLLVAYVLFGVLISMVYRRVTRG